VAFEMEFDLVYDTLQGALEVGQVLTVSEVNARVEQRLESDPALQFVRVRGEVSSWSVYGNWSRASCPSKRRYASTGGATLTKIL
jgi:hypothetical protein